MSPTAARRTSSPTTPSATSGAGGRPHGEAVGRSTGSRPAPSLSGEVRGSLLLFALALVVTLGAAAAARLLAGLTP